jgi:hypothetical protein
MKNKSKDLYNVYLKSCEEYRDSDESNWRVLRQQKNDAWKALRENDGAHALYTTLRDLQISEGWEALPFI